MSPDARGVGPWLVKLSRRVAAGIFQPTPAEEVEEELDFHLRMTIRKNMEEGMSPEAARRDALQRLGDIEQVRRACRESGERRRKKMTRREWFGDLGQDLRFAFRQIRKNPVFAAVAILTLAVGIGANTAVFSVVNGVLLRPLPYPDQDELVRVWTRFLPESGYEGEDFPLSPREAVEYRDATTVMETVAYYDGGSSTLTGEGSEPQRLPTVWASFELFPLLGVQPQIGRWFSEEEDAPDGPSVVVLSDELWAARFGRDPSVLGRTITLDGTSAEVVGIMPAGFGFPDRSQRLYRPVQLDDTDPGGWGWHGVRTVSRLASGRSLAQADAELASLVSGWRQEYGHPQVGHSLYLRPLRADVVRGVSGTLWLLMASVGLVLLIAAANVANLLLARGESRAREVSVRVALGAGRLRIVRQLLTESVVLAAMGALLGVVLAWGAVRAALFIDPSVLPRTEGISMDLTVLGFTAVVALGSAFLFGMAPALQTKAGASNVVTESRSTSSSGGRRLRRALVVSEVALSLLVVVSAGLVGRSFVELVRVDTGVESEGRLTFNVELAGVAYPSLDEVKAGIAQLIDGLEAIPGVTSASFTSSLPLVNGARWLPDFRIEGRPRPTAGERMMSAATSVVTPGFVETMGIDVIRGRAFTRADRASDLLVALVNREAMEVYWPGEDPVGQRIGFSYGSDTIPWATVVGVVENTRVDDPRGDIRPQIYLPHEQEQGFWGAATNAGTFVLHTAVDPSTVVPSARRAVATVDPNLPLSAVRTMEDVVDGSVAQSRLTSGLLGSFGIMALLLAMVGVYGVVSYSVARRTREIGIRVALGADRRQVVGMMVKEGARPALIGVAAGLAGAFFLTSYLSDLLFRVSPTDPLIFATLPIALSAVAVLASWIPSLRATRVPPTEALRQE
jgi:predicted permease